MRPDLRARIEALVELQLECAEAIIAVLDAVDGDPDLEQHDRETPFEEPWLSGGTASIRPVKRIRRAA